MPLLPRHRNPEREVTDWEDRKYEEMEFLSSFLDWLPGARARAFIIFDRAVLMRMRPGPRKGGPV
jgi:hypothetical protein